MPPKIIFHAGLWKYWPRRWNLSPVMWSLLFFTSCCSLCFHLKCMKAEILAVPQCDMVISLSYAFAWSRPPSPVLSLMNFLSIGNHSIILKFFLKVTPSMPVSTSLVVFFTSRAANTWRQGLSLLCVLPVPHIEPGLIVGLKKSFLDFAESQTLKVKIRRTHS